MATQVQPADLDHRYDWQPGRLRQQIAIADLSSTPMLIHAGGTLLHDLICSAEGVDSWLHMWDSSNAGEVAGMAPALIMRVSSQGTLPLSFAVARSFYNGLVVAASRSAKGEGTDAHKGIPAAFLSDEPAVQPTLCLSLNYSAG